MSIIHKIVMGSLLSVTILLSGCNMAETLPLTADVEDKAGAIQNELFKGGETHQAQYDTAVQDLVPVELERVIDGDTIHVTQGENRRQKELRLLLIDTPETVHPEKGEEPFGRDASDRMKELMADAEQIYIEYDTGERQDHYGRELVYVYVEDAEGDVTSVQETLLEEGLARVGYVYEQQRYLTTFQQAESMAKSAERGIWSMDGYVNVTGEGFNSEE